MRRQSKCSGDFVRQGVATVILFTAVGLALAGVRHDESAARRTLRPAGPSSLARKDAAFLNPPDGSAKPIAIPGLRSTSSRTAPQRGDVYVGVGFGYIEHFDNAGNLLETLDIGTGCEVDGMAFRRDNTLLATSGFGDCYPGGHVVLMDEDGNQIGPFGGGYSDSTESVVVDQAGHVFVGQPDGTKALKEFDSAGNFTADFSPAPENRGTDWNDLAADQCTMFYTSEGGAIKRFDICNDVQLPDLANDGGTNYALRIRPNGEVIVAAKTSVRRYDADGFLIQIYSFPPDPQSPDGGAAFGLALDPDGRHFWVGIQGPSGLVYKIDIVTGDVDLTLHSGIGAVYGLAVFGLMDSDGDGIPDDWESQGITVDSDGNFIATGNTGTGIFIDLPAMGADPMHKDVFVHADWMGPDPDRAGVVFKPKDEAIQKVIDAFAAAPVDNPDQTAGINLHVDLGPDSIMNPVTNETWKTLSQSGEVPFQQTIDSLHANSADWSDIDTIKQIKFAPAARGSVFHYALFANNFSDSRNGGLSKSAPASDFIITLGDWPTPGGTLTQQASTFMHELGHNLGLQHGGGEDLNYKPNYISIMNYRFGLIGVLDPTGRHGYIDYSTRRLPTLDELHLDESVGIQDPDGHITTWNKWPIDNIQPAFNSCYQHPDSYFKTFYPEPALDWNCDGSEEGQPLNTPLDLNSDGRCVEQGPDSDVIYATPTGDDVLAGGDAFPHIVSGPNRTCETTAACDPNDPTKCDTQWMPVGYKQPEFLTGFEDWHSLLFFGDGSIGSPVKPRVTSPTRSVASTGRKISTRTATSILDRELSYDDLIKETPPGLLAEEQTAPTDVVTYSPQKGAAPLNVNFDGSSSTATIGATITSWSWDFGDGTNGSGSTASHTYSKPGTYFASLTVTDNNGQMNLGPLRHRVTVIDGRPNLAPYQPPGWSGKVVITTTPGSRTDSGNLQSTDALYLNFAIINSGNAQVATSFSVSLLIDGTQQQTFTVNPPIAIGAYTAIQDYSLGHLSGGLHVIRIVADSAGVIDESNEADNQFGKTIGISGPSPTPTPQPTPSPTPTPTGTPAVDINGTWNLNVSCAGTCSGIGIGESGNNISISGSCPNLGKISLTGTIDSSGQFSASGTSQFACSSLAMSGTAASDGSSLSGTLNCGGFGNCSLTGTRASQSTPTPAPSPTPTPTPTPTPGCVSAQMISPISGSTLQPTTTFTWSAGSGNSGYYLYIGTKEPGGYDVLGYDANHQAFQGTNTSVTVSHLPEGAIYVRLVSVCAATAAQSSNDYVYDVPVTPTGAGSVDPTFLATAAVNGGVIYTAVKQPDGKIILGGHFKSSAGRPRSSIARINPDGSDDPTFDPGLVLKNATDANDVNVRALAVQPDGKILMGMDSTPGLQHGIYRLNSDGSMDPSFTATGWPTQSGITSISIQTDGKILVGGGFTFQINGRTSAKFARLNADGSLDPSFDWGLDLDPFKSSAPLSIMLEANGKILIGGAFVKPTPTGNLQPGLAELNPDGRLSKLFGMCGGTVTSLAFQPDGKIIAVGNLTVSSPTGSCDVTHSIMRFYPDGTHDTRFTDAFGGAVNPTGRVALQSDGKIIIGGGISFNGNFINAARLNTDGTLDNSFNVGTGFTNGPNGGGASINAVLVTDSGKILFGGIFTTFNGPSADNIVQLNGDGSRDISFALTGGSGFDGEAVGLLRQPDGKWLVAINYAAAGQDPTTTLNGTPSIAIGRINADLSTDATFQTQTFGPGSLVGFSGVALQPDNKIVLSGNFHDPTGTNLFSLLRLNPDGTQDTSFNPPTSAGGGPVLVQPSDGKIIVAGFFSGHEFLLRLNPNGQFDTTLQDLGSSGSILSTLFQPDGKLLIGGSFSSVQASPGHPVARNSIARLNQDGSADLTFDPGSGPTDGNGAPVRTMALQSDGKIVIGGFFFNYNGTARPSIARLNSNGSLDTSFVPVNPNTAQSYPAQAVAALGLQSDGKIVVGPDLGGTPTSPMSIFRLDADGSFDSTFALRSGIKNFGSTRVDVIAFQPDGKILVGGAFDLVNGYARLGLARLFPDPSTTPLSVVSRKVHGAAGSFDIALPLSGGPGIECRSGGPSGNHQIVFSFPNPVTIGGASVTSGTGTVMDSSVNGEEVTVDLTGVSNAQAITVTLTNVSAGTLSSDVSVQMGVLAGDTTANGMVNSSDIAQTQSQSGLPVTSNNCREDVTVNGSINSSDIAFVQQASGTGLPTSVSSGSNSGFLAATPTPSGNAARPGRRTHSQKNPRSR